MNILLLHSDKLEFEIKKATKLAEDIKKDQYQGKLGHCLVCFASFEEADDGCTEPVAENLVKEIVSVAEQVNEKTIALYPYVHLLFGKKPSKPETALTVLKLAEKMLSDKGYNVLRVPFGYYKAFEVKCKGHPLSELSREITVVGPKRGDVCEALKKEETLKSQWFILDKAGKLSPLAVNDGQLSGYNFSKEKNLEKFCLYELAKSRAVKQEPPHVALMKQLQLADYEPGSDPGNLRYPPKGKMMKALIERYVTQNVLDYGAMEIESPIMYDYEHPALKSYLNRFPARQYVVETPNKKCFLRFAACFGQFLMLHDAQISYKNMPVRMYELTKYSFRVEKRGELTGLRRLRAFTMPDTHAFCRDIEEAKKEFVTRFELSRNIEQGLGFNLPDDLELAIRVVKPFWESHKDFVVSLVKEWGKPALIEMWDQQFFYFTLKYELNFVDALGKASAFTTDQIDVENAKRYGITYIDQDNTRKAPYILHCSPSGAIERIMYGLLEKAFIAEKEKKIPPTLPLWLSPTQVRLCPVNDKLLPFCQKVVKDLEKECIRVDIDDRSETIGKKVREAELEWVPLIVVIGEKEKKSKKFPVRFKATGKIKQMDLKQLAKEVLKETKGKPFRPLPLPVLLTKRPSF